MALVGAKLNRIGLVGLRYLSSGPAKSGSKPPAPAAPPAGKPSPAAASAPVGPGASKDGPYKNPEYYTYNEMSFYDIEKDMKSFRLPQPSSLKK